MSDDITFCEGENILSMCSKKDRCYRYLSHPIHRKKMQENKIVSLFVEPPFSHSIKKNKDCCHYYIEVKDRKDKVIV